MSLLRLHVVVAMLLLGVFGCSTGGPDGDAKDTDGNDAKVDPKGRIWFGTMDDSEKGPTGEFYCFDRGEVRALGLPPVRITNGPALSPDGRILYTVDTVGQVVHASDITEDGAIARTRESLRPTGLTASRIELTASAVRVCRGTSSTRIVTAGSAACPRSGMARASTGWVSLTRSRKRLWN